MFAARTFGFSHGIGLESTVTATKHTFIHILTLNVILSMCNWNDAEIIYGKHTLSPKYWNSLAFIFSCRLKTFELLI